MTDRGVERVEQLRAELELLRERLAIAERTILNLARLLELELAANGNRRVAE